MFMEDEAFSPSYVFAPPPLSGQQVVSFSQSSVCRRCSLLTGLGEWEGQEPNHTTARKPGPLEYVTYSLNGLSPYQERKAVAESGCIAVVLVQVRSWKLKNPRGFFNPVLCIFESRYESIDFCRIQNKTQISPCSLIKKNSNIFETNF